MKLKSSVSIIAAAAAMFSLSTAVPAFSEMRGMPMNENRLNNGHMMEMGNMDRMGDMTAMCIQHASMMGLTDDQLVKIKPLHVQMQKKQVQYWADKKIAEIELKEIMDVKDFDLEKAGNGIRKIADIKTAHRLDMLKSVKEMRSNLTEDQFKKMKTMMPMQGHEKKPAKKMIKK